MDIQRSYAIGRMQAQARCRDVLGATPAIDKLQDSQRRRRRAPAAHLVWQESKHMILHDIRHSRATTSMLTAHSARQSVLKSEVSDGSCRNHAESISWVWLSQDSIDLGRVKDVFEDLHVGGRLDKGP